MATDVQTPTPRSSRPPAEGRSFGELFGRLRDETTTLFRQEVRLAKAETMEKAEIYGRNGAILGVGGALGFAAALFILASLSIALEPLLVTVGLTPITAEWLSPLIVGVVVAIVAYVLVRKGVAALKSESPVPGQTIDSLQENKEWLKQKLS